MPSLSIYVHWPFCQAKCPYCDFNSHVRASINQKDWTNAYIKSLYYWGKLVPNSKIHSIFFGGGTPSLMEEETVATIIDTISKIWKSYDNIEISLEANPTSVETAKLQSFQKSGVNRLSIGVQAFDNNDLKRLGRLHNVEEAKTALDIAVKTFDRVSFDLIYGRQDQTVQNWENELLQALKIASGHLSLYQLTIEKNTRFSELLKKGKLPGLPEDKLSVEFYEITKQICETFNFYAYEISNHAQNGHECQHNLRYWRGQPFLGIGPGAHGRVDINNNRYTTVSTKNPELWLKNVQENNFDKFIFKKMAPYQQGEEYIITGLRLMEGLDINHFTNLTNRELPKRKIQELSEENLITIKDNVLKTTETGKLFTNFVVKELLC